MTRDRSKGNSPECGAGSSTKPGRNPPFKRGNWVTPADNTHIMYGKHGVVDACEYVGCGRTELHYVRVRFENVPIGHQHVWQFRDSDVLLSPSAEIAAPIRNKGCDF